MTNSKGYRHGTRDLFSRKFRRHGIIPLSTYMKVYKVGDRVDIKVIYIHLLMYISIYLLHISVWFNKTVLYLREMELYKKVCPTKYTMVKLDVFSMYPNTLLV